MKYRMRAALSKLMVAVMTILTVASTPSAGSLTAYAAVNGHKHDDVGWHYFKDSVDILGYTVNSPSSVSWDVTREHGKTKACSICGGADDHNKIEVEPHVYDGDGICKYCNYNKNSKYDLEKVSVDGLTRGLEGAYSEEEVNGFNLRGLTDGTDYVKKINWFWDDDYELKWAVRFDPNSNDCKGTKVVKVRVSDSQGNPINAHMPKKVKVRILKEEKDPKDGPKVVTEVTWSSDSIVKMSELHPYVYSNSQGMGAEYLMKKDGQSIVREDVQDSSVPEGFRYKVENGKNKFKLKVRKLGAKEKQFYQNEKGQIFSNGVKESDTALIVMESVVETSLGLVITNSSKAVEVEVTKENIENKKVFSESGCDHDYKYIKKDDFLHEFKCTKCNDVYKEAIHTFKKT